MLHHIFVPTFVVDISAEMEDKIAAIRAYQSQFDRQPSSSADTFINRPEFLETIYTRAQFYGQKIGCKYGEPYFLDGSLKINNIIQFFA